MRSRAAVLEAAGLAALVAAAAWLFSRSLDTAANFDEGVYLASLDAILHGQQLAEEVFPDQPPGFYLLLEGAAGVFGNSVHGVRLGLLVCSLLGVVAAWACGRALGGAAAGLGAAALLVVASPFPSLGPLVEADPPAVVLSLVALALAAWAFGEPERPVLALLAGAAVVLAISVKLLALTVVVPFLALAVALRASRRTFLWALAGAAAVTLAYLGAYAGSLGELWEGLVTVHRQARELEAPGFGDNARRVLRFPELRTPFGWLALVGIAAAAALATAARRRLLTWPLWLWAAVSAAFLVWQRPLLDHHLVLLAAALAVPAGSALGAAVAALPRRRIAPASALLLAALVGAGVAQEHRRVERNTGPEPPEVTWAASRLRAATDERDAVSTDLPIVAYLADRRIPGQLIDTSAGRLGSGYLRPDEVLALIDRTEVRAVVVARLFKNYPEILTGIAERFPRRETRGFVTVYLPRPAR